MRLSPVAIGTSTCCSAQVSIWKPDGSNLVYPTLVGTNGGFLDTRALPVSGSYRILVDPRKTDLGAMTLALYDVPPDVDASISPGGPPVAVSMGPVPARTPCFASSAGRAARQRGHEQRHDRHLGLLLGAGLDLEAGRLESRVSDPVGTTGGFLDTRVLPVSGMYTILVDPQSTSLGSMTLTLSDVPPDASGSIVAGGGPVSLCSARPPGRTRALRFDGTAGQRISLRLSNVTIGTSACCGTRISLTKPDGTNVIPPALVGTNGATMTATLPVTGQYSILVDPRAQTSAGITLDAVAALGRGRQASHSLRRDAVSERPEVAEIADLGCGGCQGVHRRPRQAAADADPLRAGLDDVR